MNVSDKAYIKLLALVCLCLFLLLFSSPGFALRCGTHLIVEGDLALEVKQHCGQPHWIDRWYEEIVFGEDSDFEHRISNINERWAYNLGPQRLMRFIIIRNNRVVRIETGDYGFIWRDSGLECDVDSFALGMPLAEAMAKCGEPDAKSQRMDTITRPLTPGTRQKISISVDEWIYNLGPLNFVRILTFHNGELISIQTGPRGF